MPLLDTFVRSQDELQTLVARHTGVRIRTSLFRERARGLVDLWKRTRAELERWDIHDIAALDGIQKLIAWVLSVTEASPEVDDVKRMLVEISDIASEGLMRPYRESVWWDFRDGYDALTQDERPIFDEAFRCFGIRCFRAAIVLMWGAGAARLRHYVVTKMGLAPFNSASDLVAAATRNPFAQFKRPYKADVEAELELVPDAHILAVLLYQNVIDITEYNALAESLERRHTCGHPGLYSPGEYKCRAHAEDVLNIVIRNPRFIP